MDSIKDYNIKEGVLVDLSSAGFEFCYRAQKYSPGVSEENGDCSEARPHYRFTKSLTNRFFPKENDVSTYYFGFGDPLSVFLETVPIFREASINLPRPVLFGTSYLKKIEIIKFKVNYPLELFDLNSDHAFVRHNMKSNDDIICSVDLAKSFKFADDVFNLQKYHGIVYRTRQGMTCAVVLFETAKWIIEEHSVVIERMSAFTMLKSIPNSEKILGIKIVDDETPEKNG